MDWRVYILECSDGTLYTGVTTELARRIAEHNAGIGAKYTRTRLPVACVWFREAPDRSAAQKLERRIKQLTRADKLRLIRGIVNVLGD